MFSSVPILFTSNQISNLDHPEEVNLNVAISFFPSPVSLAKMNFFSLRQTVSLPLIPFLNLVSYTL